MKKTAFRLVLLISIFFAFSSNGRAAESTPSRNLLPVPSEITWGEGGLSLGKGFNISIEVVKESRVQGAVKRFAKRLGKRTGIHFLSPLKAVKNKATLLINCETKGLPVQSVSEDESYALTVTSKGAKLSAPNPLGILRGLETLLQLAQPKGKGWEIPSVTIHDKPRFAWRGLLIDVCRHFEPLEVLKRNLDGMAEAKMNVFHWHLSENQGFRVECRMFPKLNEMGSDGLYYTREQIKEVVAYARERGIRMVPEFDMPGHSTAWLVGYPELAAGPGPYQIERHFGVFDPTFDPTREEIYRFIDAFLGEITELFPDDYFHIGGDEVNGKEWKQNPKIQAFMGRKGFKTNEELQTYFNGRLSELVTKHGKKMVGWDEILHPGLPKTIVVQSWRGAEALSESAQKGYDGILSDGYYLDHIRTAAFHYGVDPFPAKTTLTPEQKAHVLGGEACMWGEYVSPETIDSRIWPRVLAVAERLWSPADVQDVDDLYRRMAIESGRLEELGLTHRSNYLPMLQRLVGEEGVKPLRILAGVVEPVKFYQRGGLRDYTTDVPLNRLVDAARPESETARVFRKSVDKALLAAPKWEELETLRPQLQEWVDNDGVLRPLLEKSKDAKEALPLSKDLSEISRLGLEALDFLKSGKSAPGSWRARTKKVLDKAQVPRAEVEIVVIPAIRKIILAAGQLDKLQKGPEDWNRFLDTQVEASKRKTSW